jgi:hypothetical protein
MNVITCNVKRALALFVMAVVFVLPVMEVEAKGARLGSAIRLADGPKTYDTNTLTIEQLKMCLALETELDALATQLTDEQLVVAKQEADVKVIESEIDFLKVLLDGNEKPTTQKQVDEFNKSIDRHNKLVADYKKEAGKYSVMAKGYNAKIEKQKNASSNHNSQCAHKKYYESDMAIAKQSTTNGKS